MAKQRKNSLMAGASGKIGNVVFRQLRGETVITSPAIKTPRSERQVKQAKKMRRANLYAAFVLEDPEIEKEYRTGIKNNLPNAFRVAVSDFMNAPVVHEIRVDEYRGLAGDPIKIKATDDFKVIRVLIEITDANGLQIE